MVAPASGEEFCQLLRKSGLVDAAQLDAYSARTAIVEASDDPKMVARQAIRDGLLTHFQAGQLLQGKWRGFTFGKYKVLERLGTSANSNVYLCEHLTMHRRVAVKVLPTVRAEDPGALARFRREARAAAALDHPNIVHAYDSDQDGDLHFIVMEYVDGFSLQEIVQKHGPLSVKRTAHYVKQAATALQNIHDSGLIHRDIKPGNLLLDRAGTIRILDLGLARFYQDHKDELTQKYDANNILGTADYLSPEQARDSHDVDTRTDIYSLGATIYFMLSGRPPFEGKTMTQKLMAHQIKEPTPLREVRPEIPEGLAAVVSTMMAKDSARRYPTPASVVEVLAPWTGEPISPPPDHEMPQLCPAAQFAGTPEAPWKRGYRAATPPASSREIGRRPPSTFAFESEVAASRRANERGRSSSAIALCPQVTTAIGVVAPAPAAETDNALPRTDTHRDLPRTGDQRPTPVRAVPWTPIVRRCLTLAGFVVAVFLGAAIATVLLR